MKKTNCKILSIILAAALSISAVSEMPLCVYAQEVDANYEQTDEQTEDEQLTNEEDSLAEDSKDTSDDDTSGNADDEVSGDESETDDEVNTNDDAQETIDGDDSEEVDENQDLENTEEIAEEDAADAETDEVKDDEPAESEEGLLKIDNSDINENIMELGEDYELSDEQLEEKKELEEVLDNLEVTVPGQDYVTDELIFLTEDFSEAELVASALDGEVAEFNYGIATIELDDDVSVKDAIEAAADKNINLPAVYPNYIRHIFELTDEVEIVSEAEAEEYTADATDVTEEENVVVDNNVLTLTEEVEEVDELSGEEELPSTAATVSKYNDPTADDYQWHLDTIGASYAWNMGYDGTGIKVAVLDTGVSNSDVNVVYNATTIINEITNECETDTSDVMGHGTHVAGIIGSSLTEAIGVAPNVDICNIKVMHDNGEGKDGEILKGIECAIEQNVDIINMSLGGYGISSSYKKKLKAAYNKGILVFASAGNDGNTSYNYPASEKGVISVAATDQSNTLAFYSNRASTVELSAPGDEILSLRNGGGTCYMSGTSMACPVLVGEAALILQGVREGGINISGSGYKFVDNFRAYMKKKTFSAGSGGGKGIVYLPSALGISAEKIKPSTPSITAVMGAGGQDVTFKMYSQPGSRILYTINGKKPNLTNSTDTGVNYTEYTFDPYAAGKTKIVVQAIAVNNSGVMSSIKKVQCTLKPYVSGITLSGVSKVARGKSTTIKASVGPKYAANKAVYWKIYDTDASDAVALNSTQLKSLGISISSSGKFAATTKAVPGIYYVKAIAKDKGAYTSAAYPITVYDKSGIVVSSAKFSKATHSEKRISEDIVYDLVGDEGSPIKLIAKNSDGNPSSASDFIWSSSNTKAVRVAADGKITIVGSGKAVITARANDSGAKKATVQITVTQEVLSITTSASMAKVIRGKSVQLKAAVSPSNASKKTVKWALYFEDGVTPATAKNSGLTLSKSGKVTVGKKAVPGIYKAYAYSTDGTGITSTECEFEVLGGAITKIKPEASSRTIYRIAGDNYTATTETTVAVYVSGSTGYNPEMVKITNSNSAAVSIVSNWTGSNWEIAATATGRTTGTAKITIAATDGSAKKATFNVVVLNPASSIAITAPKVCGDMWLPVYKNIQLKATMGTNYGATSKNVIWTVEDEDDAGYATISKTGVIKIAKVTPDNTLIRITATQPGSGVSNSKIMRVNARPSGSIKIIGKTYRWIGWRYYENYGPLSTSIPVTLYKGCQVFFPGYCNSTLRNDVSYIASSNKPAYLAVYCGPGKEYDVEYPWGLYAYGVKKGKCKVTVQALDGYGSTVKYNFVVK